MSWGCSLQVPCPAWHLAPQAQFGATAAWEHTDSPDGDRDHSALLPWLLVDSSHSRQRPYQLWGRPESLKKQMGGLISPTLFHLLQDWTSNLANVRARRKRNRPKTVHKTSHRKQELGPQLLSDHSVSAFTSQHTYYLFTQPHKQDR